MIHISFTDQWQTLLDENGKPLIGRVKFFNADSTQYKSIYYDIQGETQGENPQYTLQDGRLEHQVFIGSGVYTCRVEKFLGTDVSSMRDHANDDTYWKNYKSFKLYGGAEEVEGGSDLAAGFCDTIAALRLVNPSEHGVVSVIGYYSKEDGIEPRTYVWVEGNNDAEDYGSTIVSSVTGYTSAGRWKLCESPIVCATTFGVFPNRASTITPSELTTKATALAQYARLSPVCTAIQFNRGNYEFAEGARLSFTKKVITGASVVSGTTIKFGMYVEDGQTPSGTIEIAFIGGLDLEQKSPISENDDYVTFSFGTGYVRTSWLQNIEKHVVASLSYEGLTIILDKSSAQTFYNNGQTIKNWHFKGCDKTLYQVIGSNALFQSCSFEGKCFQVNNARFIDCGTLYQECICANDTKITDDVIWGSTGEIKSEGTTFVCNDIRMTKAYTGVVDNSCIKAIGNDAKIVSTFELTLKYLDRSWQLHGKIGFENSDTLYASQYNDFSDCVDYSLANPKTIDLESGSYSYTLDTTNVSQPRTLSFKNGSLELTKTGGGSVVDNIKLENCQFTCTYGFLSIEAENSKLLGYAVANPISLNIRNCYVEPAQNVELKVNECYANGSSFNGAVALLANSNNRLEQKFIGCDFSKQLLLYTASGAVTRCFVVVNGCCFNINNSGTPITAINDIAYNGGSWANESLQGYKFEGNTFIGDAYLLPVKKVCFKLTSSTDGSTTPTASDGEVSIGSLTNYTYPATSTKSRDRLLAYANKFSDYSFFRNKLFYLGTIDNFTIIAKPLTQLRECYFGQGDSAQILPISDMIQISTNGNVQISQSIYVAYGDEVPMSDYSTFIPQIEWLVEFEKV